MQVVWQLSLHKVKEMKLLPDDLNIVSKFYDDRCEQSHAIISAMDGHFKDCADVFFGPVCDYALGNFRMSILSFSLNQIIRILVASVARITKYLHNEGTPILTIGGNSFEYIEPKRTCDDEFYLLTRTGFLNYKPLALFTVEIFKRQVRLSLNASACWAYLRILS